MSPAEIREREIARESHAWELLERTVARRERELAALREPMDGVELGMQHAGNLWHVVYLEDDPSITNAMRDGGQWDRTTDNEADQWEARYLAAHASNAIPAAVHNAANAARYCASDPDTCDLGCAGCRSYSAVQTSTTTRCSTSHAA